MITGWYPVNARGENAGGSIALGAASTGVPLQAVRAEYVGRYHRDDPFAPARYLDRPTRLASVAEVGGPEALARTDYARELLPELGAAHQAALYLRDGGRMLGYVSVLRTTGQGEFTDREFAFMRRFQPFFELAYCSGLRSAPPLERDHLLRGNGLTSREQETARLAASGSTNPQIAAALMLSEATVKTHLHRVYRKLEVRNRTELCLLLGSS
jgi:DNA-binding CsgD family transcriptional regulator